MTKFAGLTINERNFIDKFIETGNYREAYEFAYDCSSLKPNVVANRVNAMKNRPKIVAEISRLQDTMAQKSEIDALEVLRRWTMIATADVNELISYRYGACRYCYGRDHHYQWRNDREFAQAIANHKRSNVDKSGKPLAVPISRPPTDDGGYGFNPALGPHGHCPECLGVGIPDVVIRDTTKLGDAARMLYNGIKQTKEGLEIKMLDRDAALVNIAKYLGMFKDKESTPAGGLSVFAPGTNVKDVVPTDPIEAAKFYRELMSKS